MLDFIKNNKVVFGAVSVMALIILIIVILLITGGGSSVSTTDPQTFPDTNAGVGVNRTFSSSSEEVFLFGTSSERFVPEGTAGVEVPDFRAVTKTPVLGAAMFERVENNIKTEYIRYTSRINGHVFDIPLATIGEEIAVSNKTILRIGNAKWSANGSSTFSRYFNEEGFQMFGYLNYVALGTSSESALAPYEFVGRPVVENIQDIAFSPNGTEYFYLVNTKDGTVGYLENVASGAKKQIWTSTLHNLTISWHAQNKILVYSNPSSLGEGVVWIINPTTNKVSVLLANVFALAAQTNPAGTKLLYSLQESQNSIFSLRVLDLETGKTTHLPIATMAEKCAWGPATSKYVYCAVPRKEMSGGMLEEWYMGLRGSDDVLWRIDTVNGVVKRLIDPLEETEEQFDIVDIKVSPQEDFVLFKTRVNNVLWALKLPEKLTSEPDVADTL